MWNPNNLVFSNVKSGTVVKGSFEYQGSKKISSINTSCGCTSTLLDGNKINVSMSTSIPSSSNSNTYQQVKKIFITYDDKSQDSLLITANLIK
jgi:hypothetical protein